MPDARQPFFQVVKRRALVGGESAEQDQAVIESTETDSPADTADTQSNVREPVPSDTDVTLK